MKVILLKDVENLGKKHDVKEVSDGYARNFLLPNNLVELATEKSLAILEKKRGEITQRAEEDLEKTQQIIAKIDGLEVEISSKAGDDKQLYGAITPAQISKVLKEKKFDIDKQQIKLDETIKEIGEYDVALEFPHKLEAKIKVIVIEEK